MLPFHYSKVVTRTHLGCLKTKVAKLILTSNYKHFFDDKLKKLNFSTHENAICHVNKVFIETHFCVPFVGAIFTEYCLPALRAHVLTSSNFKQQKCVFNDMFSLDFK